MYQYPAVEFMGDSSAGPQTIGRIRNLTEAEFWQRYVRPRVPVIIEGAINHWTALRKWTPEFWIEQYGERVITIDAKTYLLRDVIQAAQAPDRTEPPPYFRNIRLSRHFPELISDILPPAIHSEPNWFHSRFFYPLGRGILSYGQTELFIGGAGGSFPFLHFDMNTLVHQLFGHKLFILYPPSDTQYLYPQEGTSFNISRVKDIDRIDQPDFPLFAKATRHEVLLGPGDTFFQPGGWWHTARMLDFSISLATDLANDTNWREVITFTRRKARARLGALDGVFNAYMRVAGAALSITSKVPKH